MGSILKGGKGKSGIKAGVFLLLILLTSVIGYADEKIKSNSTEHKEEILVARDVANLCPIWCGDKALIYLTESGIFWQDIISNEKIKVANYGNLPLDCTPEGNWIIYADKKSVRWDKGSFKKGVVDICRYDLSERKHQKFAIIYDVGPYDILSPKEFKILLGKRPNSAIEMPEPKWEPVWSQNEWLPGGAVWLSDSSGAVRILRNKLAVEIFSPTQRSMILDPQLGEIVNLRNLQVDSNNRVYMLVKKKLKGTGEKEHVVRCQINFNEGRVLCENISECSYSIIDFNVSSDGKSIVFTEDKNHYIQSLRIESKEVKCLTTSPGHNLKISPNGKWVAFTRFRKIGKSSGYDIVTNDLFIVKLENK